MDDAIVEEVERFVRSFGYFYVSDRGDSIQIKGTFDDLDPEPEQSEVEDALHALRRAFRVGDESPIDVERVSDIERRYGSKSIRVYPEE